MTRVPRTPNPKLEQRLAAHREDPGAPGFADLADDLCDEKRSREAEEICRAGLAQHPEDVDGRRSLGRALLLRGELQAAQTTLLGLLKEHKQDAGAMLLMAELLLQKSDPGRARTMLTHAARILGDDHVRVRQLSEFIGEVTGEIKPLQVKKRVARVPLGPLIGGKGAILNVEDDDPADLVAPEQPVETRASAGPAARWAWLALAVLVLVGAGVTGVRMRNKAGAVRDAVGVARKACRQGSLAAYRTAHARVMKALEADPTSPDLKSWKAKIEARMALEYLVDAKRVPASIFAAEKVHRTLRKNPPGLFRRLQVTLGLTYRSSTWGREHVAEARAIQQLLQGVQPGPVADRARQRTVTDLTRAMKANPKALDLRYVRGLAFLAAGDPAQAQADLEAVVAKDKDHVPAQLALAGLLLERGRVVDAQERYNRVIGVNPKSLRARLGLVLTRLVRGTEYDQAERDLQAIQPGEGTPRLIRGWYRLARAWLAYGRGRLKEAYGAVKDAGRSLLPEPQWLSWYVRLALLLGDVDRAQRPLRLGLAVVRSPREPRVRGVDLEIRVMQGIPGRVLKQANALLKTLPPKSVAAKRIGLVRARALLAQRSYPDAATAFRRLASAGLEASDKPLAAIYGHLAAELARRQSASHPPKKKKKGDPKSNPLAAGGGETPPAVLAALTSYDRGATKPIVAYARARLARTPAATRSWLNKAHRHHRDAALAGAWLAELAIADGDVARGRRLLAAAFSLAPSYYPALRTRARLRRALGRLDKALSDLTVLCYAGTQQTLPRSLIRRLRYVTRWSARLVRFDRSTLCPSPLAQPDDLYLRATLYLEQQRRGMVDLARLYIALGQAAGGDALTAAVLRARADLSGRPSKKTIQAVLKRLESLAKDHPAAKTNGAYLAALGAAHQAAGDAKAAAEALEKAAAADPRNLTTLSTLGWMELGRGERARAIAAFRKAAAEARRQEADPSAVRAPLRFALGRALMASGKTQDLKAAKAAFEAAAKLDPQLFLALVELARLDILRKQPAAAHRHLQEVLRYDAGHPEALLLLMRMLRKGTPKERERIPGLVKRLVKTARFEARQGRPADARYWLEQVLRTVAKNHPGASLALASMLGSGAAARKRALPLLDTVARFGSAAQKQQAAALRTRLTRPPAAPKKP